MAQNIARKLVRERERERERERKMRIFHRKMRCHGSKRGAYLINNEFTNITQRTDSINNWHKSHNVAFTPKGKRTSIFYIKNIQSIKTRKKSCCITNFL